MRIMWFLVGDQFPVIPLKTLFKLRLREKTTNISLRYGQKKGGGGGVLRMIRSNKLRLQIFSVI